MPEIAESIHGKYTNHRPNTDIPISKERIRVNFSGKILEGQGEVFILALPKPRLAIKSAFSEAINLPLADQTTIDLLDRNVTAEVININTHATFPASTLELLSVVSNAHIEITQAKMLSNIVFHLMNFDDFLSSPRIRHGADTIPSENADAKAHGSRVILSADGWKVTIDSTPYTEANVDLLGKLGGYAITHVGKIEREDASPFSLDDGKELLAHLMYFLSFVRGSWVSPSLSIGTDTNGNEVWQEWGIRKTGPWSNKRSCFDKHHVDMLPMLYNGFRRQITNPAWSTELLYSIYWYIESNAHPGGTDGALIQSQVALESLAWNFLVKDKKLFSSKNFEKLPAAKQFRHLISECNIPAGVPHSLVNLANFAKTKRFSETEAIVRIRNRIVHPPKKSTSSGDPREQPSYAMEVYEAMTLALWYVELIILQLCAYNGNYSSRVSGTNWVGEIEPVPWATSPHP